MPVAIETVIIIIVVVSFAVLSAVIFALYWLWRLLQEDRRCNRLNGSSYHPEWRYPSSISQMEDGTQRALLGSRRTRNPRINRRQEVCVDERSRRRGKATRCTECQPARTTTSGMQTMPVTSVPSVHSSVHATIHHSSVPVIPAIHLSVPTTTAIPTIHSSVTTSIPHAPEVIVLDGTEPPPPYEAIAR
ncbi:uncharacterized protein [Parasteatoda tepidariorum]|uniref:uncharacterized protein n=1 Tax=Parasteatoda tepidariorum TaxID=114398 RepID=UPI00077FB536|nr:uncharacterized protein LOC107441630 [Parasteatoda tepidariorum]XP_042901470.1 uncharacterized protein LOC107441630 [Parasteatoda tepidariorum]